MYAAHRPYAVLFTLGRYGVDLFLSLSGFCLFWPLVSDQKKPQVFDCKRFVRRRLWRIAPPYYGALILALVIDWLSFRFSGPSWWIQPFQDVFPASFSDFVQGVGAHLLFLHGLSNRWAHQIDGAFWSLSLEMQFYALFPLLIWLKRRNNIFCTLALPFMTALIFRATLHWWHPIWLATYVGDECCLCRWTQFGAGMAAAWWVSRPSPQGTKARTAGAGWCLCLSVGMFAIVHSSFFLLPILWAVAFGTLLVQMVEMTGTGKTEQRGPMAFAYPTAAWMGQISYSVYLTHGSVYRLLAIPLSRLSLEAWQRELFYFLVGVPLALWFGQVFFTCCERPVLQRY